MRERAPWGGCFALLSSLLQGSSSPSVTCTPGTSAALDAPSAAVAGGGEHGRGGGGGVDRPGDGCALIRGYWSGAEMERELERLVAAGVQPNANT